MKVAILEKRQNITLYERVWLKKYINIVYQTHFYNECISHNEIFFKKRACSHILVLEIFYNENKRKIAKM